MIALVGPESGSPALYAEGPLDLEHAHGMLVGLETKENMSHIDDFFKWQQVTLILYKKYESQ